MRAPPLPDVSRLVYRYLVSVPEVAALVGERVFTAFPKQIDDGLTFVLVTRIGGLPVLSLPLVVDLATIQLDVYGGPQVAANELAQVCRSALSEWQGEQPNGTGNVCGVVVGPMRYVPDETWKSPKPRYVCDFDVTVKPAGQVLAGQP